MYVHCMYSLGLHPVPKRNIQITFGLGSDRFSPEYPKSLCVWFWFTLMDVCCTYWSLCTMYAQVRTYMAYDISYVNELDTVNTVNDIFLRKQGR